MIHMLNAKSCTPEAVIADLKTDEIEYMVIVAKFKDGTWDTISSNISLEKLAMLSKVLERRVFREFDESAKG